VPATPVRRRAALLAAALAGASLVAAPAAHAFLPSFCSVVGVPATKALVPASAARALPAAGGRVVGGIRELGVIEAEFGSRAARDAGVRALRAAGVAAEAERTYRATKTPKDPYLPYQWGLYKVGAPKAWDRETGRTAPVLVAVLDTGVDLHHPDLAGRVTAGKNVADNTDDPSDDNSHGTHVAGIVAAATNNKVGVAGMSWGAKVLAVKVLGADGSGSDCDVALGMVLAVRGGAKVLNLSLGADGADCGLVAQEAADYAHQQGALVVVAAGNAGAKGNPTAAPGNCAGVLTVGATDQKDKVAKFSTHKPYVGISAPGVTVVSTYFDPETGKHSYAALSGTSMATPFVSGLAALLFSKHATWTPDEVRTRITSTADDLGLSGRDDYYGAGRINAARALAG
jgi:subtilisin family serine protease